MVSDLQIKSRKERNLDHLEPLIKEATLIAQIVMDQKYDADKWKQVFSEKNCTGIDDEYNEKFEKIVVRPGTPLSEI